MLAALTAWSSVMPLVNINVIEGENMRPVSWVMVEEVKRCKPWLRDSRLISDKVARRA